MEVTSLLIGQIIAHIGADYFFQTNTRAKDKNEKGFKSRYLIGHILIVFLLSWILSFQLEFVVAAGIIAITHYFIDGCKPWLMKRKSVGRYAFFIDQLLHLTILFVVVFLFSEYHGIQTLFSIAPTPNDAYIALAYLLCLKPTNVLIKEVFYTAQLEIVSENELPNAGKLIGILERLLTLTFILIDQFEAVGFLIAAKSVLRYRDDETLKTEYVLIGTMLSFGVAVVLGIFAGNF